MLRKAFLIWLLCLAVVAPLQAANFYVATTGNDTTGDGSVGNPWLTIGKCETSAGSNNTCNVAAGLYDERVTVSGVSGLTFISTTPCDPDNEGTGAVVRSWTVNTAATIQGFEITNEGMSADTGRSMDVTVANTSAISNCFHDSVNDMIRYGSSAANFLVQNNFFSHPKVTKIIQGTIGGTATSPFATITAGVNDNVCIKVNGGTEQCDTIPSGSSVTGAAAIGALVFTGAFDLVGADGKVAIFPSTGIGPGSTIELTSNTTAQTILGMTIGEGTDFASGIAIAPSACTAPACDGAKIIGNTFEYVTDFINVAGSYNEIRGNTAGPNFLVSPSHVDFTQNNGPSTNNLIEGNTCIDHRNADSHFVLNQEAGSNNWIVRGNTTLRCTWTSFLSGTSSGYYFYNNSWVNNGTYLSTSGTTVGPCTHASGNFTGVYAWNNIYKASVKPSSSALWSSGCSAVHDYNLWTLSADPAEAHDVLTDPLFVDETNGDYRLGPTSPANEAGYGAVGVTGLPQTNGTGSSSTALVLDSPMARAFQDWATNKDWIDIGCDGNTVQISSINSDTSITLASAKDWGDNEPVCLFKNAAGTQVFYGTVPDIGAIETQSYADPPTITSTSPLTNGDQDMAYSETLTATDGEGDLTWSLAIGSSLPPGYSLNASTGEISGTCTSYGLFSFTVEVEDEVGQTDSMVFELTVDAAPPGPPPIPTKFPPFRK